MILYSFVTVHTKASFPHFSKLLKQKYKSYITHISKYFYLTNIYYVEVRLQVEGIAYKT